MLAPMQQCRPFNIACLCGCFAISVSQEDEAPRLDHSFSFLA